MVQKPKGWRPPQYTSAQVMASIEQIERSGGIPDATGVKGVLCQEHGISPGINIQSLGEEVSRQLDDRQRVRTKALIDMLPDAVRADGNKIGSEIAQRVLEVVAHLAKAIRDETGEQVQAKEEDLDALRQKNRALRDELSEKSGEIERSTAQLQATVAQVSQHLEGIRELEIERDVAARGEARMSDLTARMEALIAQAELRPGSIL